MGRVSQDFVQQLVDIVGEGRVSADPRECRLYSRDIGVMPSLIGPFVNTGTAGAVVRPRTEDDIVAILRKAGEHAVPVVPRAASTSGYGGVQPREGALVMDVSGLDRILSVDAETLEVTCEAGAVWEDIAYEIRAQGLDLCMYPSSFPSSTVGGWLAQGGSGFGSYEYGLFKENVLRARVVLPDGSVRECADEELRDGIADAEGITGVITQVTFKARPLEETEVRLMSFPSIEALDKGLTLIRERELPMWSVSFLNPTSVRLKRALPGRRCHEYEKAEQERLAAIERGLPESYLVMIAFPCSRAEAIDPALAEIVAACGAERLDDEVAAHEWADRANTMKLKRIGPSIVPTEVIVPREGLAATLGDIERNIRQPFVMEGMYTKSGDVVLLGYIPHDDRRFSFNLAFALALSAIRIARRHGGSAYSTGLYFRSQATAVLGAERLRSLERFKERVDPQRIMNPGKVLALRGEGGRTLDRLMGIASVLEPAIRPIANAAKPKPYDASALGPERHGIPGEVAYTAHACARCGYCVRTCEQYAGRGWESQSPRGRYAVIDDIYRGRDSWDRNAIDAVMRCTTCERCDTRCQLQLPIEPDSMVLRGKLVHEQKKGTFPPFEMMAAALEGEGDIWAGKRDRRADWVPADVAAKIEPQADILYFAGCTASYVENDIAEATIRLLQDAGYRVTYLGTDEQCCGIPMKMAGKWDLFEKMYRENVAAARAHGATTVVTSCPACALVWKDLYREEAERLGEPYEIEAMHYSELIAPAIRRGDLKLTENPFDGKTVTFHDSCHMGRAQGIYEPPRDMIKAIPGIDYVEMEHNREQGICCGSVITLVSDIETGPVLGGMRLGEACSACAHTVVAACPCCQVQLRDSADKLGLPLEIDDLARVTAVAAGHDIPKSDVYTSYMWGYFDKFIRLMDRKAMAEFMVPLFGAMVDAMPAGMGPMMRAMAQLPGGPALMAKMMPVLFPRMAPAIMGKVMPQMIELVEAFMGEMPPDMAELMPELLPKTMGSLMPTYIPELVPYLVPLFIEYLKTGHVDLTRDAVVTTRSCEAAADRAA